MNFYLAFYTCVKGAKQNHLLEEQVARSTNSIWNNVCTCEGGDVCKETEQGPLRLLHGVSQA